MTEKGTGSVVPPLLEDMVKEFVGEIPSEEDPNYPHWAYVQEWLTAAAEEKYQKLVERDGLPFSSIITKYLCEIALLQARLDMHEAENRTALMPSTSSH